MLLAALALLADAAALALLPRPGQQNYKGPMQPPEEPLQWLKRAQRPFLMLSFLTNAFRKVFPRLHIDQSVDLMVHSTSIGPTDWLSLVYINITCFAVNRFVVGWIVFLMTFVANLTPPSISTTRDCYLSLTAPRGVI